MFQKISLKLIIAVSITTLITIGIFSFFNIRSQTEALTNVIEKHANELSETIKKSTRYDMLANRRTHIHNIINTIGEEEVIKKIRIFNKEGKIIYSNNAEDIDKMVDMDTESCYACHVKDEPLQRLSIQERTRIFKIDPDSSRVLGIINPIYNEKSCWDAECHAHSKDQTVLGVLDITVCLKNVDDQLSTSAIETLIFALLAITVIGFIIGIFVTKSVNNPVRELVAATNRVALGNLSQNIEVESKDELGLLANSFNNMMSKLSSMRVQLFQSDKMASLGRLSAGVAHEINNPLTGILTYSSFLLKRMKDNPEVRKDLEVIVNEAKRSREIVKGLLDFSRQSLPRKGKVDINEVITNVETVVLNQLKIKKIQFFKELDTSIGKILGDENQLQQVMLNLIVNGIDAIGENSGIIKIKTSKISLSPYGAVKIGQATCPKGHNLIDEEHKIDGLPSIKLVAKSKSNEGFIHLDPIYGKLNHHYGIEFSKDEIVRLFCPVCKTSLVDEEDLGPICNAPTYKIVIPDKGLLVGCTKYACGWQKWDYIDSKGNTDYVIITIHDSGCGIPEENMSKIFEPFFTTKGQKGTGLGLSIIWGIVDNHNGKISVDSNIGSGTTFTVRLPVNPEL